MPLVVYTGKLLGDGSGALQTGQMAFAGFVLLPLVGVCPS